MPLPVVFQQTFTKVTYFPHKTNPIQHAQETPQCPITGTARTSFNVKLFSLNFVWNGCLCAGLIFISAFTGAFLRWWENMRPWATQTGHRSQFYYSARPQQTSPDSSQISQRAEKGTSYSAKTIEKFCTVFRWNVNRKSDRVTFFSRHFITSTGCTLPFLHESNLFHVCRVRKTFFTFSVTE